MLTVCRLCLTLNANFVITNGQAALRIMTCTGLEFDPDDALPQLICQACRLRLEEFHHFRKRCHAADRRLRHLKLIGRSQNYQTAKFFKGNEEDEIILRDVKKCTPTACSESNSRWRNDAASQIHSELKAYKKDLLNLCKEQVRAEIEQQVLDEIKQKVRAEIEQQVRKEVQKKLLEEVKKECRVNLLDDLFYEVENVFIQKRNKVVCEQACGSDKSTSNSEAGTTEQTALDAGEVPVIELLDEESDQKIPMTTGTVFSQAKINSHATVEPLPMVQISMENPIIGHILRDIPSKRLSAGRTEETLSKQKRHSTKTSKESHKRNESYNNKDNKKRKRTR